MEYIGWVWVGIQQRPAYGYREIRRGKNKGKVETFVRKARGYRKMIVAKSSIRRLQKPDEFTYDNPCPLCGNWLFHEIEGGCY